MTTYHLHRWSVRDMSSPYQAPELNYTCLSGFRDQKEQRIRTSRIVSVHGREVQTENSIYILEDIDPEYLQWMHDNGLQYDYDNPIKMR